MWAIKYCEGNTSNFLEYFVCWCWLTIHPCGLAGNSKMFVWHPLFVKTYFTIRYSVYQRWNSLTPRKNPSLDNVWQTEGFGVHKLLGSQIARICLGRIGNMPTDIFLISLNISVIWMVFSFFIDAVSLTQYPEPGLYRAEKLETVYFSQISWWWLNVQTVRSKKPFIAQQIGVATAFKFAVLFQPLANWV